jgi:quercetin dioxygenase-like cupin family protein
MNTNEAVLSQPFLLQPDEARGSGPLRIFDDRVLVKLSGADTGGHCAIMEIRTSPGSGPPLHRHQREDESFYVLEGNYEFEVDGKRTLAGPGCYVYAPRGTAHAFRNLSGTTTGRMLVTVQPAGLDDYFAEFSEAVRGRGLNMSVLIPIARKYGVELLGPPLEG